MKESMMLEHLSAIPPTKLVDRSYSAYRGNSRLRQIPPTKLVDRSYSAYRSSRIQFALIKAWDDPSTASVGFQEDAPKLASRLSMNNPPTALVGFGESHLGARDVG